MFTSPSRGTSEARDERQSTKTLSFWCCRERYRLTRGRIVKQVAFTLAEVLITLGIIGVVAALTMPTLMAKYQTNVLRNQAKKCIAIINTSYQKTLYDYGISAWTERGTAEATEFMKSFLANMNVVEKYENTSLTGKIPVYSSITVAAENPDESSFETAKLRYGVDGEEFDYVNFINANYAGFKNFSVCKYAYYLNDGSLIIPYPYGNQISVANFLMDVNGKKGPNRWGYDLFLVQCSNKKPSCSPMNLSEKGGVGVDTVKGL